MESSSKISNDNSVIIQPRNLIQQTNALNLSSNMQEQETNSSWLTRFCKKCHEADTNPNPSWEPSFWQKLCPRPICPTYRKFAQYVSFLIIVLLLWGLIYTLSPKLGSPKGQLCNLVALVFAAYVGGTLLFKLTTMPALIGMLLMGILLQNIGVVNIEGNFTVVTAELRRISVVIILTRAGLSLDQPTMKKLYVGVLKLGLIPWLVECIAIAILTHYFLNLPWNWSFLLSCIIASVSPAVVVPCFIRLRSEGYGVAKGIPTLVLAAASIDDTTSIAVYGIISSIMFTASSLTNSILQGPLSIIGGIGFGVMLGFVLKYVPEKNDRFVVILRVMMLFFGCYLAVLGSSIFGYAGAGPLAIISAAFVASYHWSNQGWDTKDNPVANVFRLSWIVFEPTLFGITGAQVKLHELDPHIVSVGAGCLFAGVAIRILATIIICFGSNFNMKEKVFIGLSWMAKATVQAALGPLAIESVKKIDGTDEELEYAKTVMMICILSIVLTAPLGAVLISISGPRLLSKSRSPRVSNVQQLQVHNMTVLNMPLSTNEDEKQHFHNTDSDDNNGGIGKTHL